MIRYYRHALLSSVSALVILSSMFTSESAVIKPQSSGFYGSVGHLTRGHPTSLTALQKSGLFLPHSFYPGDAYYSIHSNMLPAAIADLNGDSRNDVAVATGYYDDVENDGNVFIFYQDVKGGLSPPIKYATHFPRRGWEGPSMDVGDVNNDGRPDLIFGNFENVEVLIKDASGAFLPGKVYPTTNARSVKVGDLNGDGRMDVIATGADRDSAIISVWLQTLDGELSQPVDYRVNIGSSYPQIGVGDLNSDGRRDIVAVTSSGYEYEHLAVLLQGTDRRLGPPVYYDLGPQLLPTCVDVGDVNGDSRDDVLVTYGGNLPFSHLAVLLQNNSGTLDQAVKYPSYHIPENVKVADIDSDGKKDVVVFHGSWEAVGVYLQGPDGNLLPEELYEIFFHNSTHREAMAVGDINADGKLDVVVSNRYLRLLEFLYHVPAGTTPELRVSSPNARDHWSASSRQRITWESQGRVESVRLDYSTDGGFSYSLITASAPNAGGYDWVIPEVNSLDCVVRVFQDVGMVWDTSDKFSILGGGAIQIARAFISSKKLIVLGVGFDYGATILVNGLKQKTENDGPNPGTTLIAKKGGKKISEGQTVILQVRNPNGKISPEFSFSRTP